jgi:hypothetical protein
MSLMMARKLRARQQRQRIPSAIFSFSGILMKDHIFDNISPHEALEIIRQLAETDKRLKKKIIELAENLIGAVNVDEICEAVFDSLDEIDVHELWDRAGPNRDDYISPEEMSVEMFEEAIEPYVQEMYRMLDLKLHQDAKSYCMGILKGIYQYHEDSTSEFKNWATDIPEETFGSVLSAWGEKSKIKDKKEIKSFIQEECPKWFELAIKRLAANQS